MKLKITLILSLVLVSSLTAEVELKTELNNLGFGAGIGVIYISGDNPISNASVDQNNIIRVDEESNVRAGGILEAHYLFNTRLYKTDNNFDSIQRFTSSGVAADPVVPGSVINDSAHGVVVSAELGDDIIRSLGLGYIRSWRRLNVNRDNNGKITSLSPRGAAFNLSFLILVEPKVKTLADGLTANEMMPTGDTIRFKNEARIGGAVVFSAGF